MWRKVLLFLPLILEAQISDYRIHSDCFIDQGREFRLLRSFKQEGVKGYLVADTQSLQTKRVSHITALGACQDSPYTALQKEALKQKEPIQNAGITQANASGYALTLDLCPSSKKGFEKSFFETLIARQKGFPVALSITGGWIDHHQEAFDTLRTWRKADDLKIVWINHGETHPYDRDVEVQKNFINLPHIDADKEITALEKRLLEAGEHPSIFYRYAGLVSTPDKIARLVNYYGLIPLGSKAWLAKGEKIKAGSIVLLHGNLNEPQGIAAFLKAKPPMGVLQLPQLFSEGN